MENFAFGVAMVDYLVRNYPCCEGCHKGNKDKGSNENDTGTFALHNSLSFCGMGLYLANLHRLDNSLKTQQLAH